MTVRVPLPPKLDVIHIYFRSPSPRIDPARVIAHTFNQGCASPPRDSVRGSVGSYYLYCPRPRASGTLAVPSDYVGFRWIDTITLGLVESWVRYMRFPFQISDRWTGIQASRVDRRILTSTVSFELFR